jgi:hypothetical protein
MTRHWYFFVHIMKTGGTTLHARLLHHFGDAIYPRPRLDGPNLLEAYMSVDHLLERLTERGEEIEIITGHLPLRTVDLIPGEVTTLTLLRHPVDRVLSLLRSTESAEGKSLEQRYDAFLGRANNNMTKMLTLTPEEMAATLWTRTDLGPEELERAKQALAGMSVVGLLESFEDFCDELARRFGWDLGGPTRKNISPPADVPDGLRARIAEDNQLDMELYGFARELVASRALRDPASITS